jgi:hypothetical protein
MRHTLLPLHERIVLRREYYRRVTIVFCFTFSLAVLVGIATLFPTFIRAMNLQAEAEKMANEVQSEPEDNNLKEIQKSVAKSLSLLDSLQKEKSTPKISDLIEGVINMRGVVTFTNFTATKTSTTTFAMSIQGVAPSRNALLTFKNNFENQLPGNKIDLPVSELAKNSNFQFTLQLRQKIQ